MRRISGAGLRRSAAVVLQILPLIAMGAAALVFAPRLGPTMATHWSGFAMEPDGYGSTWMSFWISAAIAAAVTAIAVAVVLMGSASRENRKMASAATLIAAFPSTVWIVLAGTTADAASPESADLGARLGFLVIPFLVATVVFLLFPVVPETEDEVLSAAQGVPEPLESLAPNERLVWSRTITSPLLVAIAVVLVASAVALGVAAARSADAGLWTTCATLTFAALSVLALSPARLTIDRFGVRLRSGAFGIPLIRIPLSDIDVVSAETIEPVQWGGWGYRFTGRGRAYVIRRGPGVVVHRAGGSVVAVTVRDAEEAAAAANALRDRSRVQQEG